MLLQGHGAQASTLQNLFCRTCKHPDQPHQGGVTGSEVWVVLVELVEVVGVPGGNGNHGEWENVPRLQKLLNGARGQRISLFSAEGGAVSADALAPRRLVQHLKRDHR